MESGKNVQVYGGSVGSSNVYVYVTHEGFTIEVLDVNSNSSKKDVPLVSSKSEYIDGTYDTINNLQLDVLEFAQEVTGEEPREGDLKDFYNSMVYHLVLSVMGAN